MSTKQGAAMFAPKFAEPQTKTAETPISKLTPQRSVLVGHRPSHDSLGHALLLQRTIGNQATLRLLAQQRSRLVEGVPDNDHEQEAAQEKMTARAAPRGASWDFTKIPIFAPDRVGRPTPAPLPQASTSNTAAPPQISRKCNACERGEGSSISLLPEDGDVSYATLDSRTAPPVPTPAAGAKDAAGTDAGAPPQATSADTDYCAPTGKFTDVPSGALAAFQQGDIFGVPFHTDATFDLKVPCRDCKCGEYRQLIRGTIKRNGTPLTHNLCGNVLDPTTFQEDCVTDSTGDSRSGYHSMPQRYSKFSNPDQATGCTFNGFDWPGFRVSKFKSGDVLEQDIHFEGRLVDACASDKTIATSAWSVTGSTKVP